MNTHSSDSGKKPGAMPAGVCDLQTGICGEAENDGLEIFELAAPAPQVTLYYVTDPICSHCWALEPVLNRFLRQYGGHLKLRTVMGGLLPGWAGFADKANGIGQPSDVAEHWREVGEHSRMPIDGSLWHTDPIQSSYPPSRVFKVMQARYPGRESEYLRLAREAVFAFNRNIGKEEVLIELVNGMGLNGSGIVDEAGTEAAQELLEQDFALSARLGVRGFPTIVMANEEGQGIKIVGARALGMYVEGLERALGRSIEAARPPKITDWLREETTLFAREIEVMYDLEPGAAPEFIAANLKTGSYRLGEKIGETYVQAT